MSSEKAYWTIFYHAWLSSRVAQPFFREIQTVSENQKQKLKQCDYFLRNVRPDLVDVPMVR